MRITLERYESTDSGTFGVMKAGHLTLHTVERPWLNNEPFESCIPPGEYKLIPYTRNNGDEVYALVGGTVSLAKEDGFRRYAILIHIGNWMTDVVGCVAPGLSRSGVMVQNSKMAMDRLMNVLGGQDHTITIDFKEYL